MTDKNLYWKSIDELAETPEFTEQLRREFPDHASLWHASLDNSLSRRRFLEVISASLALAGLTACSRLPVEKIIPYVIQPEELIPGKPLDFATAILLGGYATGVLVQSHMGRPTKIEGNPDHPASLGATDSITQAQILSLYDPDRSKSVIHNGIAESWDSFLLGLSHKKSLWSKDRGAGLRILTETMTSPTFGNQMSRLLEIYPQARWHSFEPIHDDSAREGALLSFGEALNLNYRFDQADLILSLDCDFFLDLPGSVRYSHDFSNRRRVTASSPSMSRLYAIEATPSLTGAMADHCLAARPSSIENYVTCLANLLGLATHLPIPSLSPKEVAFISAIAKDLQNHRKRSIILAGRTQSARVHAWIHAINFKLGNFGQTIIPISPVEVGHSQELMKRRHNPVNQIESLRQLILDMDAGKVETLIIIGGNPVYNSPADLNFSNSILNVPYCVRLSLYEDETSAKCEWHLPQSHSLETWSDARAFDGTATIMQPLISPLYSSRSYHWLMASLIETQPSSDYQIVRDTWRHIQSGRTEHFDTFWETSLHKGVVEGSQFAPKKIQWTEKPLKQSLPPRANEHSLEIVFRPDPMIWDGRFANNSWLQEIYKPLSKLSWDNAVLISYNTAKRLSLSSRDVVRLKISHREVRAPIWILPGHADDTVTVHLGFGRTRAGKMGNHVGFNSYLIQTSYHPVCDHVEILRTEGKYIFAEGQDHHSMEGRDLIRSAPIHEFRKNRNLFPAEPLRPHSLYPEYPSSTYAWGMVIDLNTCIGCSACTLACQAENNIPSVGRDQILKKRDMYWIRIDRYYRGSVESPQTYFQPVPCMHCEKAPCEVVCPTAATVHDQEGLNEMIYNRCIGTRYCSNNCPYKVRRFNFFQYSDYETPSLKLMRNPDVTVRTRGVMEKCTYCVQRIEEKRIESEIENRKIQDGEIKTACQQVCPAQAITFGDLNTIGSQVSRLKSEPQNYGLLSDLGTRPRTTYLAKFTNQNPEIER